MTRYPRRLATDEAAGFIDRNELEFVYTTIPGDCERWEEVRDYPVRNFTEWPLLNLGMAFGEGVIEPAEKWLEIWERELRSDKPWRPKDYYRELEEAWLKDPDAVGPVVLAEYVEEFPMEWPKPGPRLVPPHIEIGDGWHRIMISVVHGLETIPAIIGRNCQFSEPPP